MQAGRVDFSKFVIFTNKNINVIIFFDTNIVKMIANLYKVLTIAQMFAEACMHYLFWILTITWEIDADMILVL